MSTRASFFFQAEDGIRAGHVTGVQTCALPILGLLVSAGMMQVVQATHRVRGQPVEGGLEAVVGWAGAAADLVGPVVDLPEVSGAVPARAEPLGQAGDRRR